MKWDDTNTPVKPDQGINIREDINGIYTTKLCFSHKHENLEHGKCTWCEKSIQEIVAQELKHE